MNGLRSLVKNLLELAGIAAIVGACWLASPIFGLVVLGAALFLVGWAI